MLTNKVNIVICIISIVGVLLMLAYARFPIRGTLMSLGQNVKQMIVQVVDTLSPVEMPTIGNYTLIVFLTALGFGKLLGMYKTWQNAGARNGDLEDESDVTDLLNQDYQDESV